jgi:hypothetical protein
MLATDLLTPKRSREGALRGAARASEGERGPQFRLSFANRPKKPRACEVDAARGMNAHPRRGYYRRARSGTFTPSSLLTGVWRCGYGATAAFRGTFRTQPR